LGILLKFTLRNIRENKFRTFLIIFSVMLSTALFFGSIGLSGTIEKTYVDMLKKDYGEAEVMIHAGRNSPSGFLSEKYLTPYLGELDYAVGVTFGSAAYKYGDEEVAIFRLRGYDLEGLQKMHQISLAEEEDISPFRGHKLIIGKGTAERFDLALGHGVDLEIDGVKRHITVAGIAQPTGLFQEDGQTITAVVPKEYLNGIKGVRGKANYIYLKLKNSENKEAVMGDLSAVYRRYVVEETIADRNLKEYTDRMAKPFLMMVTTVMLISIFIIYTSFKVIAMERIPIIGTFRSVGATKKMVNLIFLGESGLYGIIGGLLGCILGVGILYVMARYMTPNWVAGLKTQINVSVVQLAAAFFLAQVLTFASSLFPIWRVARIPVKDIVLNNIRRRVKHRRWRYVLGIALITIPLALAQSLTGDMVMLISTVCLLLGIVGVIQLVPMVVSLVVNLLEGVYSILFGNEGILALKNLRDNKSIVNNVALLAIGISSLLMIKITGNTVLTDITAFFRDWNFQVLAAPSQADRSVVGSIRSVDGVEDVFGLIRVQNVEAVGYDQRIGLLEGVNRRFFDFMKLKTPLSVEETVKGLDAGRHILLAGFLRDRFQVEIGDSVKLKTSRGTVPYKVVGFLNTIENNGQYAVISDRYMKMDFEKSYFDMLYIKADKDPTAVQGNINKKFNRRPFWTDTLANVVQRNAESNQQMFSIMDGFSYMTILIGIFGIFNNFLISFLERRRSLAVLRSVGLSKRQMRKMLFIEALSGGLIGGVVGVGAGLLAVSFVPGILRSMGLKGHLIISPPLLWTVVLVGIFISVLASVGPASRSSKMSIVKSLKYE